jgi:AraC-like DNA-binding protein
MLSVTNTARAMNLPSLPAPWSSAGSVFARFVEDIRLIALHPGQSFDSVRLPDGRTKLIFRAFGGGRMADVWVAGSVRRAKFKSATGLAQVLMLGLKPGRSVPLLGVAASELTDRIVPLEDVWGRSARELCDQLLAATSGPEVMDRIARALAVRADQGFDTASGQLARRAVRLLEGGEVRVERVADRLGVTSRHLRRTFTESVGIGPKEFTRTVRLRRAVRMAATSCDWARIAAEAGYYDQAHLIADFRDLIGLTPGAFMKQRARAWLAPAQVAPSRLEGDIQDLG